MLGWWRTVKGGFHRRRCADPRACARAGKPWVRRASALTDLPPLYTCFVRRLLFLCSSLFLFFFFCFDGGCTFSSGSVKAVWLSWVTEHFAGDVSGRHWSGPASTFILIHWANGDQWRPTGTDPRRRRRRRPARPLRAQGGRSSCSVLS